MSASSEVSERLLFPNILRLMTTVLRTDSDVHDKNIHLSVLLDVFFSILFPFKVFLNDSEIKSPSIA